MRSRPVPAHRAVGIRVRPGDKAEPLCAGYYLVLDISLRLRLDEMVRPVFAAAYEEALQICAAAGRAWKRASIAEPICA